MFYKLLGFAVWKGIKSFVNLKYPHARQASLAALVVVAVAGVAASQARSGGQ